MSIVSLALLVILATPAVLTCSYLMALTLLSRQPRTMVGDFGNLRFDLIVPAHNEAAIIARTIASLRRIAWPADRFRIIVVADNCTDATASISDSMGVNVLIRSDLSRRGKGYALQHAFNASLTDHWADAAVIVDADTDVSANMLTAFAARVESGAQAVQAHYSVRNPMASWRTRLITIATASFMQLRSRARERLNLSCGIRGNGWCVTLKLLEQVPYRAFSLAEDVEYGIDIGLAGHRVAYADEAYAKSDMVTSERLARTQRRRWENGRFQLISSKTPPLLAHALKRRSALCLDLGIDLLVLPLAYVVLNVLVLAAMSVLLYLSRLQVLSFLWIAVGCFGLLALHVGRGWQLSGVGSQGLWDLCWTPWYLIWKLCLKLRRGEAKEWVRTKREHN